MLELDPESAEAVSNLSLSHLATNGPKKAFDEARRTIEIAHSYTTEHLFEGLALCRLGRHDEAISGLRDLSVAWCGCRAARYWLLQALAHIAAGVPPKRKRSSLTSTSRNPPLPCTPCTQVCGPHVRTTPAAKIWRAGQTKPGASPRKRGCRPPQPQNPPSDTAAGRFSSPSRNEGPRLSGSCTPNAPLESELFLHRVPRRLP